MKRTKEIGKASFLMFIFWFQDAVHPEKLYKLGQAIHAKVVEVNAKRFVLSLTGRRSFLTTYLHLLVPLRFARSCRPFTQHHTEDVNRR